MKGLNIYITQEDLDKYIKSKVINDEYKGISFVPTHVEINSDYSIDITLIAAADGIENDSNRYKYSFEEDNDVQERLRLLEEANKLLREMDLPEQYYTLDMPSVCDGCSNNPKNGGTGICNCTIPYFENPIMYSTTCVDDSSCAVNNIDGRPFIFGKKKPDADNIGVANAVRIAEAIERTKKYEKRD